METARPILVHIQLDGTRDLRALVPALPPVGATLDLWGYETMVVEGIEFLMGKECFISEPSDPRDMPKGIAHVTLACSSIKDSADEEKA